MLIILCEIMRFSGYVRKDRIACKHFPGISSRKIRKENVGGWKKFVILIKKATHRSNKYRHHSTFNLPTLNAHTNVDVHLLYLNEISLSVFAFNLMALFLFYRHSSSTAYEYFQYLSCSTYNVIIPIED